MNPWNKWLVHDARDIQDIRLARKLLEPEFVQDGMSQYEPHALKSIGRAQRNNDVIVNQNNQPPPVKRQNKAAKNQAIMDKSTTTPFTDKGLHEPASDYWMRNARAQNRMGDGTMNFNMPKPKGILPALGGALQIPSTVELYNNVQQYGPIQGYKRWLGYEPEYQ